MPRLPVHDDTPTAVVILVAFIAVLMLIVFFAPAYGCVERGAVQVTFHADVTLDDVRGVTLANAQQEQGQ